MRVLESYVCGGWLPPSEDGVPLEDAVTGQVVATISSAGVDMAATVAHARSVGGSALRAMTFHERASVLRSIGKLLLDPAVKEELYALSHRTGATAKDSWIDIDGGAGVLLTYASKGRRELPNSTVAVDEWRFAVPPSRHHLAAEI